MIKTSVLLMWLIVTGVTCALDSGCEEKGNCNTTKTNNAEDAKNQPISPDITLHAAKSAKSLKSDSMVIEDEDKTTFRSTLPPEMYDASKTRSLTNSMDENTNTNELTKNISKSNYKPLSDVDMGDEDDDEEMPEEEPFNFTTFKNITSQTFNGSCVKEGITYENGETLLEDCKFMCTCSNGKMNCTDRCQSPYVKRGKQIDDPMCSAEDAADSCCSKVTCTDVSANETLPTCSDKNTTFVRGERITEDCVQICYCGSDGHQICKTRCEPIQRISDKCIVIPDEKDSCCKTVKCDVNSDEHEFRNPEEPYSSDKHDMSSKAPSANSSGTNNTSQSEYHCLFKGKQYKLNDEFSDNCDAFCTCRDSGVKCFKLECPTFSGIDILDPTCVQWETVPANFTPVPPNCCPGKLRCKSHGECEYKNQMYNNWQEIPTNVTGCTKRCYCEMGNVECQEVCLPVVATPPNTLPCLPEHAVLKHPPDDDCCLDWVCETGGGLPQGYFPNFPGLHQQRDEVATLEPIDAHTVKLVYDIPEHLVGLYGRAEVRYTDKKNDDPHSWLLQVFAPPDDFLETPQLEFLLTQLRSDTEYRIQITIVLRDMLNTHTSKIYKVRTPRDVPPTINPDFRVVKVNSSWVSVQWRAFNESELEYIDAVQLRYKKTNGRLYQTTPYIHRLITSYTIENLEPGSSYEVDFTLIPFHPQETELSANKTAYFSTDSEIDNYSFNISLQITQVKPTSVEISWKGVPYPEDKYVNIYRAVYQTETGKGSYNTFKVAKRSSAPKLLIMDLKPGTRYRLWLETYLTNGKIRTSNVEVFVTKPGSVPTLGASSHDKLSGVESDERGDYYGPLVIVAILATIAILSTLVLLLILIKRHSQNKASITQPPRVSQSAYDNPTYKVEIQQETMNL